MKNLLFQLQQIKKVIKKLCQIDIEVIDIDIVTEEAVIEEAAIEEAVIEEVENIKHIEFTKN